MTDDKALKESAAAAETDGFVTPPAQVSPRPSVAAPVENGIAAALAPALEEVRKHIKDSDEDTIQKQRELAQRLITRNELGLQGADEEAERSMEEIKQIDSQVNRLNSVLDRLEKQNSEVNDRLQSLLDNTQKQRQERKASLVQREEENQKAQQQFETQISSLLEASRASREGRKFSLQDTDSTGDLAAAMARPEMDTVEEEGSPTPSPEK